MEKEIKNIPPYKEIKEIKITITGKEKQFSYVGFHSTDEFIEELYSTIEYFKKLRKKNTMEKPMIDKVIEEFKG